MLSRIYVLCFDIVFAPNANMILFRGLALDRIFVNFLKLYCDAGNLVIVVNTNSHEEVNTKA